MLCFYQVMSGKFVKVETIRYRKDGKAIDVEMLAYPVMNEGEQVGIYIIYSNISERKVWEEKLKDLAFNDSLTGLFTRRVFMDRLSLEISKADRHQSKFGVVFIDVNKFKQVNDNYGHEVGDKLLKEVGKRLKSCVRKSDTVARMGGDEFTILLMDLDTDDAIHQIVNKILTIF